MKESPFSEIVTGNQKMLEIFEQIQSISVSRQPVLITGETGVGKELFAKAIHKCSDVKGSFVPVNAAGLDESTFSDTLFGHVRGAFTGAEKARKGQCEKAINGTLFLDEIGDISLSVQVKLLRLLQEGEYQPLGSENIKKTNARILAATNADLWEQQRDGRFRSDLNYRLRTHHFNIPPLCDRIDDIPLLVNHFLDEASLEFKKRPYATEEIFDLLKQYSFPGNIRELRAMVYNAVGNYQSGALSIDAFKSYINRQKDCKMCFERVEIDEKSPFSLMLDLPTIKEATEYLILEAMKRSEGNQTAASKILGISQPALSNRLKKMSLQN